MPQSKEPKKVKTAREILESMPKQQQTIDQYVAILDSLKVPRATKKRALAALACRQAGLED